VHFGDKDECFRFWVQKVRVQGHGGVQHFLALLARYLKNRWTKFHQTFVIGVHEARDELIRF